MRASPKIRTAHPTPSRAGALRPALVLAAAVMLLAGTAVGPGQADAAIPVGTSDAGIVPVVMEGGHGGNVECSQVPSDVSLSSSDRLDWQGGRLVGTVPDGLEVDVHDGRSVSWSADFPLAAVIVKGGPSANVYVSPPLLFADSGLVAPVGPSGQPADVSNVTFCWDPDPTIDLLAVCRDAAVLADVGPIVSFSGPIEVRDGIVVQSTVPEDHVITFDLATELLGFVAPYPVVAVVTATSAPTVHSLASPSLSGTVPLAANPGDADVVLCGLDTPIIVSASCAQLEPPEGSGTRDELGPVPVRAGAIDPADVPEEITGIGMHDEGMWFTSSVPVIGVVVTTSPSQLHAFDEPTLAGSVPMRTGESVDGTLMFCVLRQTVVIGPEPVTDPDPVSDPDPDPVSTPAPVVEVTPRADEEAPALPDVTISLAQDPVLIATGGGPPLTRLPFTLLAFVILSLTGSATMLLWSRDG